MNTTEAQLPPLPKPDVEKGSYIGSSEIQEDYFDTHSMQSYALAAAALVRPMAGEGAVTISRELATYAWTVASQCAPCMHEECKMLDHPAIDKTLAGLEAALAATPQAADNWQQYAKEGENAQKCIERHRTELHDFMTLYVNREQGKTV
jgi:hypothetical protein